jgi:hypothetical protein
MYKYRPGKTLQHSSNGAVSIKLGRSIHADENGDKPNFFVQVSCLSEQQAGAIAFQFRQIEETLKAQHKAGVYSGNGKCQCARSPQGKS